MDINERIFNCIHAADREGLQEALRAGASANGVSNDGITPLHAAVAGSDLEIVRLLLAADADQSFEDPSGMSPMELAAELGRVEMVTLLAGFSAA